MLFTLSIYIKISQLRSVTFMSKTKMEHIYSSQIRLQEWDQAPWIQKQ
jgi:hypothetical protein